MKPGIFAVALTALFASTLPAAYSNLIATGAGDAVYFEVATGLVTKRTFVVRNTESGRVVDPAPKWVVDVSGSGSVVAASVTLAPKYCPFGGRTCLLAQLCVAVLDIEGPGIRIRTDQRPTFVRLDRQGALAWIDQGEICPGVQQGYPLPPFNGLYETTSGRQIAPANGAKLANQRYGRRLLDDRARALVFVGNQLSWLSASGVRAIRHVAGAYEAVVDRSGSNIVYVEAPVGKLHWIAEADEDLGLTGSAPALSDDGYSLVYLAADDSLRLYDRNSGTSRRLGPGKYSTFTLGGNAAFAVTLDNQLVRIDLVSGVQSVWLEPFPEIHSADAPPGGSPLGCITCYGTLDYGLYIGRGMLLVLRGRYLDHPGWRARVAGVNFPVHVLSDTAAWIQIPSDLPLNSPALLELYHPEHPLVFDERVSIFDRVVTCFGALHQDFSRIVTAEDPAKPGEIVHVFLTGLRGVESIPDGSPNPLDHLIAVANPPTFADSQAIETLFFGLAPGSVALQQLDIRVRRAPVNPDLFSGVNLFGCAMPPSAVR